MAVAFDPLLVAQLLDGCCRRGTHIVAKAEGVAHLMRTDETDELPHELVGEVHGLGTLVERAALRHVPLLDERHDVVIPADVSLDDFARTGVDNARTIGILGLAGQIAQHGETGVVDRHGGVVGPVLGHNGILEAGGFEGHIPIVDALLQILHPLLGRSGVNIVDDLLLGLHQTACLIGLDVLGLKAIARDDGIVLWGIIVAILRHLIIKIADAIIEKTGLHGHFGQKHQRGVETQRGSTGLRSGRLAAGHGVGAQGLDFDVDWIGLHGVDERTVALHAANAQLGAVVVGETGDFVVGEEQTSDLNELVLGVGVAANDIELIDNGVDGGLLERLADGVVFLGERRLDILAQEKGLLVVLLEVETRAVDLLASEHLEVLRHACKAGDGEDETAQQRVGHLEIPLILDVTHGEQTYFLAATFLHELMIGRRMVGYGCVFTTVMLLRLHWVGY